MINLLFIKPKKLHNIENLNTIKIQVLQKLSKGINRLTKIQN